MIRLLVTALTLSLLGGVAIADRQHDRRDNQRDKRAGVRDQRDHRPHAKRVNRPAQRADRRVLTRRPIHVTNGHYVFHNGVRRAYTRPVIRARYYNVRHRPQFVVENYAPVPGYIWVRGNWNWNGREWRWNDGHFAPDPQYSNYYDDGSYDYSVSFSGRIGG
jgi:hypothetical protein